MNINRASNKLWINLDQICSVRFVSKEGVHDHQVDCNDLSDQVFISLRMSDGQEIQILRTSVQGKALIQDLVW